jgi:5-methyltetrahydrofolate--homocysteine methyltransferase
MEILETILECVVKGKLKEVEAKVQQAFDENIDADQVLNDGLLKGMDVVAENWKKGLVFVPEVLRSAKVMNIGMDMVKPLLTAGQGDSKGTFAIGTVKGDLHDIGKNLVILLLESVGYEVVDIGIDAPASAFVEQAEKGISWIGLSALLTTTTPEMKGVIDSLEEAGLREKCKIWVGGAPVTQEFADEIGADFYAVDASQVIDQLHSLH